MMRQQQKICTTITPELYRRAKELKIQWSEALRVGIASIQTTREINLPENSSEFSKQVLLERYKQAMIQFINFSEKMQEFVKKEEEKVRNMGL